MIAVVAILNKIIVNWKNYSQIYLKVQLIATDTSCLFKLYLHTILIITRNWFSDS